MSEGRVNVVTVLEKWIDDHPGCVCLGPAPRPGITFSVLDYYADWDLHTVEGVILATPPVVSLASKGPDEGTADSRSTEDLLPRRAGAVLQELPKASQVDQADADNRVGYVELKVRGKCDLDMVLRLRTTIERDFPGLALTIKYEEYG